MDNQVPARIANILINALKGGVVPRVGLEYITVGRAQEIAAILYDIDMISDGGASFRFIVGKYGSGKSFLLQTIRNYATAKGFAVVDADLSPERRFAGTKDRDWRHIKNSYKIFRQNPSRTAGRSHWFWNGGFPAFSQPSKHSPTRTATPSTARWKNRYTPSPVRSRAW